METVEVTTVMVMATKVPLATAVVTTTGRTPKMAAREIVGMEKTMTAGRRAE